MRNIIAATIALAFLTTLAMAEPVRVTDAAGFETSVVGRDLTALGVKLRLGTDGSISGRAFGRDVTGDWRWTDGYFCRTMNFGARRFELNCQTVTIDGTSVQFRADKGQGEIAKLRIR